MLGDWHIQEVVKVVATGIGALTVLYQIVLYTRGPLLRNVVNPQRVLVATTAVGVAMIGYWRLAWTAQSSDPFAVARVMRPMLTEEVTPVSVVCDPAGRFLYALNEGADSISLYALDQKTGKPTPGAPVATGVMPSAMALIGRLE